MSDSFSLTFPKKTSIITTTLTKERIRAAFRAAEHIKRNRSPLPINGNALLGTARLPVASRISPNPRNGNKELSNGECRGRGSTARSYVRQTSDKDLRRQYETTDSQFKNEQAGDQKQDSQAGNIRNVGGDDRNDDG